MIHRTAGGARKPRNVKAILAVAAGLLAFAALGYLVLISPQRSRAAELSEQIGTTEQQIIAARTARRSEAAATRVDELFRLTKAMPDRTDMPGILLELSRVAGETGITFDAISPRQPASGTGFQEQPVDLIFHGNFYELSDFLFRLRNLVSLHGGKLDVDGRLYAVDAVDFTQAQNGTQLEAKLTAKAFVYGAAAAPTGAAPATPAPAAGATG